MAKPRSFTHSSVFGEWAESALAICSTLELEQETVKSSAYEFDIVFVLGECGDEEVKDGRGYIHAH